MDEAEYCDRISIMVDGRIAALGTPAELKERFERATHRRGVRAARAPGERRRERAVVDALARVRAEGAAPHPARPADADDPAAAAARAGRAVRLRAAHRRARRPARDRRSRARLRDACALREPLRRQRGGSESWPSPRRTAALEPLFQRGAADVALVFEPGFADDWRAATPARLLLDQSTRPTRTPGRTMQATRAR